mgnify:FL=1
MLGLKLVRSTLLVCVLLGWGCPEQTTETPAPADILTASLDIPTQLDTVIDVQMNEPVCSDLLATCLSEQKACIVSDSGDESCTYCPKGSYPSRDTGLCIPIEGTKDFIG